MRARARPATSAEQNQTTSRPARWLKERRPGGSKADNVTLVESGLLWPPRASTPTNQEKNHDQYDREDETEFPVHVASCKGG